MSWSARTKDDLAIEVWEKLDCENVGAAEIEAIEGVVADVFGKAAVDSPMAIARLLADEGADLRHSELMRLWVERSEDEYAPALNGILKLNGLGETLATIRRLENLRSKYQSLGDKEGLRRVKNLAIEAKDELLFRSESPKLELTDKLIATESAEWLRLWLQSPQLFDAWVDIRQQSAEFVERFGSVEGSTADNDA